MTRSVMSDSLRPHGLYPARLLWPWNSPGKKTGVGWHSLLQGIFLTQGLTQVSCIGRQILYPLSHKGCPSNSLCLTYLSLPASTPSPQQPLIFYYNCVIIFQLWFIILSFPDCHIVRSYFHLVLWITFHPHLLLAWYLISCDHWIISHCTEHICFWDARLDNSCNYFKEPYFITEV